MDLPILQKTYDFYKLFHVYAEKFPKKDRYTVGQRSEDHILNLIEKLVRASKSLKSEKSSLLFDISVQLDTLKILIRLMKDTKVVDLKRYAELELHLFEIGKMLGGWMKYAK